MEEKGGEGRGGKGEERGEHTIDSGVNELRLPS